MALTGGLAIWGVLVLSGLLGWLPWPLHTLDWVGIHGMACMGALDDRFDLRARYKAVIGFLIAILLAVHASAQLAGAVHQLHLLNFWFAPHPVMTFPLLVFWFWSIPQAYNLIDGVNGLSMGLGLLVLAALGWHQGFQPTVLEGAMLATLVLNFPRARHFLGDCGAMMLGTLFAVLSVNLVVPSNGNLVLWVFAYPIVDVSLVVAIRAWNGQPLAGADRSHLHHWMMDHLDNKAWLVTPTLLCLAALPMLRITELPGAHWISLAGGCALLILCGKAFHDRTLGQDRIVKDATSPFRRELFPFTDQKSQGISHSHRSN